MTDFMIRFLICNVFLCCIIGILFAFKALFRKSLSNRMKYHLWFLMLGLLAVPFLPVYLIKIPQIFPWLEGLKHVSIASLENAAEHTYVTPSSTHFIYDFSLSVTTQTPSFIGIVLFGIWIAGILMMILGLISSLFRLKSIAKSALPLQNHETIELYCHCLEETGLTKAIPIYSTAFLKSPVLAGLLKPRIYLPIHLISDYNASDMHYILLHELQHYKHMDNLASCLMNLAGIIYWFNPIVWYALRTMYNDREIACDTAVLNMIDEGAYIDYGNTLINFAEKIRFTPFPFTASLGGSKNLLKKRIKNIVSYEKPTAGQKLKGLMIFGIISIILFYFAPALSVFASNDSRCPWVPSAETISLMDLSSYFEGYEGSLILYDLENDSWYIHNLEQAVLRTSPNSTYKIYDALFGLEEGIITPDDSLMNWNNEIYPFETWNRDQTLSTAMESSVNWYFQAIDQQLGTAALYHYIHEIGYGNENVNGGLSSYWMESSLKISPIEQISLLAALHTGRLNFSSKNIDAVKDALCLFSSEAGTLYGKTGTGRIDGQDVNGWFVGYADCIDFAEHADFADRIDFADRADFAEHAGHEEYADFAASGGHTWFFAVNITADSHASGSHAADIALAVLSDLNIWN